MNHDNNNTLKIHPQPMEETTMHHSKDSTESLIFSVFDNISYLKAAYIELQRAHTPYDPEKIQAADKLVIKELVKLSELKHSYREKHPRPVSATSQDTHLVSEIQEQQNLLKTYDVMVKKFQSQIQIRDVEIFQLQKQIQESGQRKAKLEKKLKQRGLFSKDVGEGDGEENSFFSVELNPSLLSFMVEPVYRSVHEFSKLLMNLMKAAGWDLDAAASSIEPEAFYARRAHKKFAFESHISYRMFSEFEEEGFGVRLGRTGVVSNESFFHQFLSLRGMDPLEALSRSPDSHFGKFCRAKYLLVVHPKMEGSFFGNLDHRNFVSSGGHPRTPFYQAFLKLAKSVWLLHRLVFSFEPKVNVFQVKKGTKYSDIYMESVVKDVILEFGDEVDAKVEFMVMPGFMMGGGVGSGTVIQAQVYLSGVQLGDGKKNRLESPPKST